MTAFIGCAGWSIPGVYKEHFPTGKSHLERYAMRFSGVEINSSFYRPHRLQTYEKWAATVPSHFRFSVKVPKAITHEQRLKNADSLIEKFLSEVAGLGEKLGPLLVQMPPSLSFEQSVARNFLISLRQNFNGQIVLEPRHPSWFDDYVNVLLRDFQVSRVAADPALVPQAFEPGGWEELAYYRLHGAPVIYRSSYNTEFIEDLAIRIRKLTEKDTPVWCIFDNTAEGAATANALRLMQILG